MIVAVLLVPLMILDLWRYRAGILADHTGYRFLAYSHVVLFVVLIALLVYLELRRRSPSPPEGHQVLLGATLLILLITAGTSLIDQLIHGEVTVYTLGAVGVAIAIYLPFGLSLTIYGAVYLLLLALLPAFQGDPAILTGHLINLSLLTAIAVAANVSLYRQALKGVEQLELIEDQNEELKQLAWWDPLTGVANRRLGEIRMEEERARYLRYRRPFSLVMSDIDRFKAVNDQFSHAVGDRVLKTLAELLESQLREVDLVVRQGGEEFLLIMPETPASEATEVCEKLRAGIEAYEWDRLEGGLELTMSFGVADSTEEKELSAILEVADRRLREAKSAGRNRVRGRGAARGA